MGEWLCQSWGMRLPSRCSYALGRKVGPFLGGLCLTGLIGFCRAELGRSSWRLLHTMMARFPDEPTTEQQEALRSFVYLFGRLYPWYNTFPSVCSLLVYVYIFWGCVC